MKLIRFLLFPFALLYDLVTTIRNYFYDKGFLKSVRFDIPVIAVGNLSVGGTGKTPQIEYLIRLLQGEYKVAVLSRGYKRKTRGFILLNESHTTEDVGDEPLQFFKKFSNTLNVSIAVDVNRVNGIQQLQKLVSPDVILLDDAFQHRKVKAGFYILLTKYDDLYTNDYLLPRGNLRESRRGAKRAHIIVVTKCPENLSEDAQQTIREKLKASHNQQVFFSSISYHNETGGKSRLSLNELNEYEIVLITGIANPLPLVNFLNEKGCLVEHMNFPDHHHFTSQEIQQIQAKFEKLTADKKLILTTEKDYMRLSNRVLGLHYIEIESKFLKDQESFNASLFQSLE